MQKLLLIEDYAYWEDLDLRKGLHAYKCTTCKQKNTMPEWFVADGISGLVCQHCDAENYFLQPNQIGQILNNLNHFRYVHIEKIMKLEDDMRTVVSAVARLVDEMDHTIDQTKKHINEISSVKEDVEQATWYESEVAELTLRLAEMEKQLVQPQLID